MLRSLGERGVLAAAAAVMLARPPATSFQVSRDAQARAQYRQEQTQSALEVIRHYNTAAPVCAGVPFGHTRPQWILPHGARSPSMPPPGGLPPHTPELLSHRAEVGRRGQPS
ncbi:hypothetical protein [Actinomyces sp. CtC 72]